MVGAAHITDGEAVCIRGNGVEIVGTVGKGLDRAKGLGKRRVVHSAASLAILLVIKVEAHAVYLLEYRQWGGVRKNCAVFEEANVLAPELDCAGL